MIAKSTLVRFTQKAAALMLAAFMLEGAGYLAGLRPTDIIYYYTFYQSDKAHLKQEYGIDITGTLDPENYPDSKAANHLLDDQTVIKPVNNQYDLSRSLKVIIESFKPYPPTVLARNLNHLYLLDELTLGGNKSDGTYDADKKSIYLRNSFNGAYSSSWKKYYLATAINHEISSILMINYHFNEIWWRKAIGAGFQYEKDKDPTYEWMFIGGYIDPVDQETLLKRGLLRQYAETGVENDFNTYAEVIFTEPSRMSQLIQDYPLIDKKYHVFKAFYLSIDPGFAPVFEAIDGKIGPLKETLTKIKDSLTKQ